jgi:DNA primase
LNPDVQPKYLNSPETTLFHKGSIVFNFHRARQPAHDDGSVVVVEGYMDAIAIYQAGLKSVVASMGTAFTEEQIQTLWRLSAEPIVCFDADRAGINAAHRSIDRILPMLQVGRTFRFAFIQSGKDPDELIQSKGLDAFKEVLQGSLPLWDVLWEREAASADVSTPDGRAKLEHTLYAIVRTIKDPIVGREYVRTCRVDLSDLFWQTKKGRRETPQSGLIKTELNIQKEGYRLGLQKILLGTLVHYPQFLDEKSEGVAKVAFEERLEQFRHALFLLLIDFGSVDVGLIYTQLSPIYYDVLQDIHGDKTETRSRGYRLFERFPIIRHDPPHDFISECIDHFIQVLQVDQMAEELARVEAELEAEDRNFEAFSNRLTQLVRDIHLQREIVNNRDIRLAEDAKEIRRAALGPGEYPRLAA